LKKSQAGTSPYRKFTGPVAGSPRHRLLAGAARFADLLDRTSQWL
jgi:hypothetical protein